MDGNQNENWKPDVSPIGAEVVKSYADNKLVPNYLLDRICKLTKQKSCFVATFNEEFTLTDFTMTGFSITGYGIAPQLLPIAVEFVRAGMFKVVPHTHTYFHIWSIEHGAWWRSASRGYTKVKAEAGEYVYEDAKRIVDKANEFSGDVPKEAMVRVTKNK